MNRDSLRSLEHHDAFLERHIGPNDAEIAAMLGCGESTSRSQLSKARSYLQARIERKDALIHAGRTSH